MMESGDSHAELKNEVAAFLRPPHRGGAMSLSGLISKNGTDAFEELYPPIPFTGSPFTLTRSQCVVVVFAKPNSSLGFPLVRPVARGLCAVLGTSRSEGETNAD